jgi:hypothetical protein
MTAMNAEFAVTVIKQSSPFMYRHRARLITSALSHGVATIFAFPPWGQFWSSRFIWLGCRLS